MPRIEEVELPISGMTCASCARIVEGQLASTPGVAKASVNIATRTASVRYDPEKLGVEELVDAVEEVGYGVPAGPQEIAEQKESTDLRR
ncbi:MAG TPA: cation transporter, partial [Bryobacteraceae bacterium]|nr:cation transporter [Bryobacteraceae bacterium]